MAFVCKQSCEGVKSELDLSGDEYLDLANTNLYVQAKVTRGDGTELDANDPVGPVDEWLHSLFSQVDVSLNGTLVTHG